MWHGMATRPWIKAWILLSDPPYWCISSEVSLLHVSSPSDSAGRRLTPSVPSGGVSLVNRGRAVGYFAVIVCERIGPKPVLPATSSRITLQGVRYSTGAGRLVRETRRQANRIGFSGRTGRISITHLARSICTRMHSIAARESGSLVNPTESKTLSDVGVAFECLARAFRQTSHAK